jgi:pantothenate kinase
VRIKREIALARALALLERSNQRSIIAIIGKPGAGKSTFSKYLSENLPASLVAFVPMDGYHLSNKVLNDLGRSNRKGAPDTFDVDGYVALLHRIKNSPDESIYFPIFDRAIEESIAAEGVVKPEVKLVITEGNYLLHNDGGWQGVAPLVDESWCLDLPDALRMSRLINRHIAFGRTPEEAKAWAQGSDENNAQIIGASAARADFTIEVD